MSEDDRWCRLIEVWLMRHVGPGATCVIMSDAQEFQMIFVWLRAVIMIVGDAYGAWIFWRVLGFDSG